MGSLFTYNSNSKKNEIDSDLETSLNYWDNWFSYYKNKGSKFDFNSTEDTLDKYTLLVMEVL